MAGPILALLFAAALGAGLTGCGGSTDDAGPPATTGTPSAILNGGSGNPGGTSAASTPSNPSLVTGASMSYPKTARLYAEWVLAAWRQRQVDWLGDLTSSEVQSQLLEIPGPPDQTWTYRRCEGAAGSSYCEFTNTNGDGIVLQVTNSLLTKAHAVVGVVFDATVYPGDGVEYAKAFVAAWKAGNQARMGSLGTPSAITFIGSLTPPANPTYTPVSGGAGLLQVTVAEPGFSVVLDIGTTLLGTPHAVVGAHG